MYDDFIERRPGAAKELEKLLNSSAKESPASSHEQVAMGSLGTNRCSDASGWELQTPLNIPNTLQPPSQVYDPYTPMRPRTDTVIDCGSESRWLLVCARGKRRPTSLSQLDICATPSDQELFTELKRAYRDLRGRWSHWVSLRTIQSIRFVQVIGRENTQDGRRNTC
jgi:hypothetical protein